MGRRVFLCCPLYKLALCRGINLGKPPGKPPLPKSPSENSCIWLHGSCLPKCQKVWQHECSVFVNIWARIVGVSVPVLTVAVCLHFLKQEEGEDLTISRTQAKQQPAATWPRTNRKLF